MSDSDKVQRFFSQLFFSLRDLFAKFKNRRWRQVPKNHLDETQKLKMFFWQHQSKDNFSTAFIKNLINVTFHKDTLILT